MSGWVVVMVVGGGLLLFFVVAVIGSLTPMSGGEGPVVSMHSDWPDDVTEVIRDDYGRHAGDPPSWLLDRVRIYGPLRAAGRHRMPTWE